MNETELLHAMCEAYWKASPGITNSMRNILELLHAHGYRRCAEGQRVTQWCDRAEKAEAEVERLRADAERYRWLRDVATGDEAVAEIERLQLAYDDQHSVASLMSQEVEKAEAEVERLRKGISAVSSLIANSSGVYGLHLNGDPAPWDELLSGGQFEEWLADFDAARGES